MVEFDDSEDRKLLQQLTEDVFKTATAKIEGKGALRHAPAGSEDEAWKKYFELAEKYDSGMCKAFHQQIDTVLVFAGLFSAVVTAFTVESYQWLYPDSGDATVQLLTEIAKSVALDPTSVPALNTSAVPDAEANLINTLWFLALLLSLSSAFVAILSKQWISEYERGYRQSYRDGLAVRQAKLAGLQSWRVEGIATSLPWLLLQAALTLFFVGILELLYRLNQAVALPAIILSAILAAFYLVTTLLPTLYFLRWYMGGNSPATLPARNPSPYKSPQASLFLQAVIQIINVFSRPRKDGPGLERLRSTSSWIDYDYEWMRFCQLEISHVGSNRKGVKRMEYAYEALVWLLERLDRSDLTKSVWHCLWSCVTTPRENEDEDSTVLSPTAEEASLLPSSEVSHGAARRRTARDDLHLVQMTSVLECIGWPSPAHQHNYHPALQRWILLMDSSEVTGTAPGLTFELLHLAQKAALDHLRAQPDAENSSSRHTLDPQWMSDVIRGASARCSPQIVDDAMCEDLVAALARYDLWGDGPALFDALQAALRVLSMGNSIMSEHRKRLILAICPVARGWLQQCMAGFWSAFFIDEAYNILVQICRLLDIDETSDIVATSQTTRVLAALAKAIDEAWKLQDRPMQLEEYIRSSSSADFASVFVQLVNAAALNSEAITPAPQPVLQLLAASEGAVPDEHADSDTDLDDPISPLNSASIDAVGPYTRPVTPEMTISESGTSMQRRGTFPLENLVAGKLVNKMESASDPGARPGVFGFPPLFKSARKTGQVDHDIELGLEELPRVEGPGGAARSVI